MRFIIEARIVEDESSGEPVLLCEIERPDVELDPATLGLTLVEGRSLLRDGKRSGNPSFVGAMKVRTSDLGNQRDEVENGSTADGAVPGAREGVSGIGAEGQGVGRGERRADALAGELVCAFATLAGTA